VFAGRLAFKPTANYGFSGGYLDQSDEVASTLGISTAYEQEEPTAGVKADIFHVNADAGVKYSGWSVQSEFYFTSTELTTPDTPPVTPPPSSGSPSGTTGTRGTTGTTGTTGTAPSALTAQTDNFGMYLQSGYFLSPENSEIAARYSRVFLDGSNNDLSEFTLGYNYYWFGHRLKMQLNYSFLDNQAVSENSHRVLAQAQIGF
jgi:hypothetical protein